MITTQKELRAAFWRDNPGADRRLIRDYAGTCRMHVTDTRVAWCDYLDAMHRAGNISEALADRATLQPTPIAHEWQVQGNYGQGFECECSESTRAEGVARLREYRENGPGVYRLRRVRVSTKG